MRDDPTRLADNGAAAVCYECGAKDPLPKPPVTLEVWCAAAQAFARLHRHCAKAVTARKKAAKGPTCPLGHTVEQHEKMGWTCPEHVAS